MSQPGGVVRVWEHGGTVTFQVEGQGAMRQSAPLTSTALGAISDPHWSPVR